MRKFILSTLLLFSLFYSAQEYKVLMHDPSVNFYDVCKSADQYFSTIDKTKKGSGYKGYQRWKNANEYKYYPGGDRSQVAPNFVSKNLKEYKLNNPSTKDFFSGGWNDLGPYYIDSITGHYAAGLGRIEDFYVDPNDDQRIYIGSRSGGFWRTFDGGQNWEVTTDFLEASGVECFAVSPTNPDSIIINVNNAGNNYSNGIYRSIDGGATWSSTDFTPTNVGHGGLGDNFRIYTIQYHPTIPNLVFVGTSKGIYRSTDNLTTWSSQITNGDITQINFHPTDPNYIYIYDDYYWGSNQNVVLVSNSLGLSFNSSATLTGNNDAGGKIKVSADCPDCVYFASSNGVWKSTDKAQNFSFISNPNESCDGFAVSDADTSVMIYGYLDLLASTDGGNNFDQVTWWSFGSVPYDGGQYIHADLRMAKSINGVFYVATDGLLCKSVDNGITWDILSEGTGIRENYKLGTSQSNHYKTICGSQDNGTSIKTKDVWVEFYGADGMEGIIHPLNDNYMMGSVQYGHRRRTKDGGLTQDGANPPGATEGDWEAPLAYDPNHQMTIYDFKDSVWRSPDFGTTWELAGEPEIFIGEIHKAAIAENNSDIIVITRGGVIGKSTDRGDSFTNIRNNLPNKFINDVAFNPLNDDEIFVVYGNYNDDGTKVFMTNNGGSTWTNISHNINDLPVLSIVLDANDNQNIYLGTEAGVYTMPLGGSAWVPYNSDLPNTAIEELEICYGSNTLKAVTWGRGLWEYSIIDRNDYPSILVTSITDMPTSLVPLENIDQTVTSILSNANPASEVYLEWSIDDPTFGNRINMTNTQDSTWVANSPLPNYPAGTEMYFKIFAIGQNNDTTETYKFMYEVKPEQYCENTGTMSWNGNVTLVDLENISNATGKTQPYTNYSSSHTAQLLPGQTYPLTVNVNTDNGNYTYFVSAWIDWNHDTDFEDTGERFDLGSATNVSNGPTDLSPFSITVPSNAAIGPTTMRVACKFNEYPTLCETGFDGEVEDYGIIVGDASAILENNKGLLSIYPNPTKDFVSISVNESVSIRTIELYGIDGKLISSKFSEGQNLKQISLENLTKGIYLGKALNENGQLIDTFIIIKD